MIKTLLLTLTLSLFSTMYAQDFINNTTDLFSAETTENVSITSVCDDCPVPQNLRYIVEENVPGYSYRFKVTVSWDPVEEADGYSVYVNGSLFGITSTNMYIAGSDNEGTVTFQIASMCQNETSELSEPLTVIVAPNSGTCLTPTNLEAMVEENVPGFEYTYKITLTWNDVPGAISYSVYINDDLTETVEDNIFEMGINDPMTIYLSVATNCSFGSSDISEPVEVEIDPCFPPTNLSATVEQDVPGSDFMYHVNLSWDEVENASSYTIYADGSWIAYSDTPSYTMKTNEEGTVVFNVTSVCQQGESDFSEDLTVIIQNDAISEYEKAFEIYPNPADNQLSINTDETISEISIFNVVGVMLYNNQNVESYNIDITNYNTGLYFIKIKTENGEVTKKFLKK